MEDEISIVGGIPQYKTLRVSDLKDMPHMLSKKTVASGKSRTAFNQIKEQLQKIKQPSQWRNQAGVEIVGPKGEAPKEAAATNETATIICITT